MTTFEDLLARDDVTETCVLQSRVGFMAYHGGTLEAVTDAIASRAAEASGASYYGVVQTHPEPVHISSTKVTPAASGALTEFLVHVDVVITIHGYGRQGLFTSLLLGGRNRDVARHVGERLSTALPAYDIRTDLEAIPRELRGQHPRNPVNLARHQGVQIELPPRVRGSSPLWWDWEGPGLVPHTEALIDALATAATEM